MRLGDFIKSFRARRARQLVRSDTVSFEAFCNDSPRKQAGTKESSLSEEYHSSPAKVKIETFSRQDEERGSSFCPNLTTILLVIVLTAVFLILPIAYLLNCFDVIYKHSSLTYASIKDKEHYEPSAKVHEKLSEKFYTAADSERTLKTLPFPPKPDYGQCKLLKDNEKFDCHPEDGANPNTCEARGCCWIPAKSKPKSLDVPLNVPYCFFPPNYNTYNYVNVTETAFGLVAFLKRNYRTAYPNDVEYLKLIVKYETDTRLHIKIVDPNNFRFEPPYPELPIVDKAAFNTSYSFEMNINQPGFQVLRKSDRSIIFDANNFNNLIFSNQFLQISTKLPTKYIYGLGEHRTNLLLSTKWTQITMFNHDSIPSFNRNLYGSHPFYLALEPSFNAHGVFLLNSNAMDVIVQPTPAVTFRPIGGVLDFYFFMGPTPAEVVSQYTELVGMPFMPPYWALGFHLCRFGYKSVNDTRNVMQRNIDAGIPLDTQWNDLDYMNNSNDFTYDTKKFKELPQFIADLHARGMHYIPLIDAGVSGSEPDGTYAPYDIGIEMNIFVKNTTDQPFVGKVWNQGTTVWPDFTHPNTVDYWTKMLDNLHKQIEFDGAWIDMNEPSNFLNGAVNGCPKSPLENPPYLPAVDGGMLNYKTMCMTAKHYAGVHYDVHNLFGFTEAIVTSFALSEIRGKRPMVISRSTFSGFGHYAGHWSGDVVSEWLDMRYTIPQLLMYSIFGIPMMGADICGFNGNTTEALCNRWMQLGAFYPFSRNHNTDDGLPQDPAALGPQVIASSKKALSIRYSFLPYLYTLFWKAHTYGHTVSRPLFFEFPKDENTFGIDMQFLWGSALMIVPVLNENDVYVDAYLPAGIWYDFYTKTAISSSGQYVNWTAPLDTIPLFVRGGSILPQQAANQTTTDSRKNKIELLASLDENKAAYGELYWDDGDSLLSFEEKRFSKIAFSVEEDVLRATNEFLGSEVPPNLGMVTILGLSRPVTEVMVNNISQAFKFDTVHKYLLVEKLDVKFENPIVMSWKYT